MQPQNIGPDKTKSNKDKSFITAVFISLLIFVLILSAFEGVARALQGKSSQPIRSIGSFHSQFETKWFKLKDYVKKNGGVDVLFMGNSMVNTGIDPDLVAQEYAAVSGEAVRVFNFGVEGMDLFTNSELAALLVEEYHPKTIIFFTEMREYGPVTDTSVPDRFKTDPWFQYKLGNPSAEAWIYDHSFAMQYFLPYRNWGRADFPDTMLKNLYRYSQTTASGYEPDHAYGKDLDVHTDPTDPAQKVWFDLYRDFKVNETNLDDLAGILDLHARGVQVIVTEMPVYKTFYDYFGGEVIHQQFLTTIAEHTETHQGFYFPPVDSELIPLVGRVDNHHLNFEGAPVYSKLLGQQLGTLCLEQKICLMGGE